MTLRFPPEVVTKLDQLADQAAAEAGRRPSHNEVIQNLIADAAEVPLLASAARPRDISAQHAINAIRLRVGEPAADEGGDVGAVKLIAREFSKIGQDRAGAVMFAVAASLVLRQRGAAVAAAELLHTARVLRVRDVLDGPIDENVELRIALAEYALELDPENATARSLLSQWLLWAAQAELRSGAPTLRARRRLVQVGHLLEWSDQVLGDITAFDSHAGYARAMARLELATLDGEEHKSELEAVAAALGGWAKNHDKRRSDEERARWVRQVRFLRQRHGSGEIVARLLDSVRRLVDKEVWAPVLLEEVEDS